MGAPSRTTKVGLYLRGEINIRPHDMPGAPGSRCQTIFGTRILEPISPEALAQPATRILDFRQGSSGTSLISGEYFLLLSYSLSLRASHLHPFLSTLPVIQAASSPNLSTRISLDLMKVLAIGF